MEASRDTVVARIYVRGGGSRFIPVCDEDLAEKAVQHAMEEFSLPRSFFHIVKGVELAEMEAAEGAARMAREAGITGFMHPAARTTPWLW